MKIKVKVLTEGCMPVITPKGDRFDLRAAKDVELHAPQAGVQYKQNTEKYRDVKFNYVNIPLGVAMEMPKGIEAEITPRSGTFKKWYIIQPNSPGVVDYWYKGDEDEWKMPAVALNNTHIKKGDRICQVKFGLSQKATLWQRIKWFFNPGVKFVQVESLNNAPRGGFGSTGTR